MYLFGGDGRGGGGGGKNNGKSPRAVRCGGSCKDGRVLAQIRVRTAVQARHNLQFTSLGMLGKRGVLIDRAFSLSDVVPL